ncbi:MAG TPA: hypothetical protein VFW87_21365 [Pirellulales bacterium]|nr:hypothetical protein [Pirellulales bacterium]
MNVGSRRKVVMITVLLLGVGAWGYAGWKWWRKDSHRVYVPPVAGPLPDPNLPAAIQPGIRPEDLLEPVELSTELTADEETDLLRLGRLVELAHEQWPTIALDGQSSAPASPQIMKQYTAWVRDRFGGQFERCAEANASWRPAAAEWLDQYVTESANLERRSSLREAGQQLVDQGCDDWLVRYCLYRCQDDIDKPTQAASAIRILQPLDTLADAGYPPAITYRIYLAHAEAASLATRGQPAGLKQAIEHFTAAVSEPLSDDLRRFYALRLRADMRGVLGKYLGSLAQRLEQAPSADRWFARLVRAIWHIERGWQSRGGGYASEVTPEGWEGFAAHLKKAQVLLLQCWDEHPDCPDAATQLIRVTMGAGGIADDDPRFWFSEAVAAQFDFREAYDRLRWALRPRWGGSHEAMLAFGRECLATERFDTDVPWQLHLVLKEIGSESDERRDAYRAEGVYEDYQKLLAGYRQRPELTPKQRLRHDARAACVACLAGHLDDAKEMLTKLGDDVDLEGFADFDVTLGEVRREVYGLGERPALANVGFLPGVQFIDLASEGHALLVGGIFSGARIADTSRGCEIIATLSPEPGQAFRGASLSAQGTTLVTVPMSIANQADTPSIMLWDVESQSKRREWKMPLSYGAAFVATFSPDGRYVAVGGMSGSLVIWDVSVEGTEPVFQNNQAHTAFIYGLAYSGDGRRLATVSGDRRAIVWNVSKDSPGSGLTVAKAVTLQPFAERLGGLSLSRDGGRMLVDDADVTLWDLATEKRLLSVAGGCACFSPDGQRFATAGGALGTEGRVWDAHTGQQLAKLTGGHADEISLVVYSKDGRRILTGSSDSNQDEPGFVRCWEAESGEEIFDFSGLK